MILTFGGIRLHNSLGYLDLPIPSESPAIYHLQSFWNSINAYYVEFMELPTTQTQLESYMSFSPDGAYTFSFTSVDSTKCYFQCTSSSGYIYSYTRTIIFDTGSIYEIICKKKGIVAPGPADYIGGGVLSCPIDTIEV